MDVLDSSKLTVMDAVLMGLEKINYTHGDVVFGDRRDIFNTNPGAGNNYLGGSIYTINDLGTVADADSTLTTWRGYCWEIEVGYQLVEYPTNVELQDEDVISVWYRYTEYTW